MNIDHFKKLERMYLESNLNQQFYSQTEIKIEAEKATISMPVTEKFNHVLGAMHGSVYFKLLDDSAFFAVNSMVEDIFVLTTSFNINIVTPVKSGKITAVGKLRFKSRNLFIAESILYNEDGKEVAFGSEHFAKSRVALSKEIGYQ